MKNIFATIFFIFIGNIVFSQDVIVLKNGTKIEAKVVEINTTSIRYYKFEQQDGPIRILEKYEVSEIVYEDGTSEKFNVDAPAKPIDNPVRKTSIDKPSKDPLLEKGFFFEGFLGLTEYTRVRMNNYNYDPISGSYYVGSTTRRTNVATIGIRLGNKWYFGNNQKWRPGIQVTWFRLGFHLQDFPEDIIIGPKSISFANVGMTNAFRFNEKLGMEVNAIVGPTLNLDLDDGYATSGISLSFEAKLRIKKFAVGLDYQYSGLNQIDGNNYSVTLHTLALSAGLKL